MSMFDTKIEEAVVYPEAAVPEKHEVYSQTVQTPDQSVHAQAYEPVPEYDERKSVDEVAFISSCTRIDGNITTEGSLVLQGTIEGNINVSGGVALTGNVNGLINCSSILVDAPDSVADINAITNVIINPGKTVTGNINCNNITVCGTVIGDITASGTVFIKEGASVVGNVVAAYFSMELGGHIKGNVECR